METFLQGRKWIALDTVTIADYSLITSITSLNVFEKIDPAKYPKLDAWVRKVTALPEYQVAKEGLVAFEEFIKTLLGSGDKKADYSKLFQSATKK